MTTKPPAQVKLADENNLTKRIYSAVEELKDYIEIENDRYRLSFCLDLYFKDEIESIMEAIIQANPRSSKVDYPVLEAKIKDIFKSKGLNKESK